MLEESFDSENSAIKLEKDVYAKTFMWMFLGLLATAIVSVFTYMKISDATLDLYTYAIPIVTFIEIVVVALFSFLFSRLSPTAVTILYFVYAVLNGIFFSTVFFAYQIYSIIAIFFISSVLFLAFALIGKYTEIDLTKIGNIALIGLLACILVTIVNMFIANSIIDYIVSFVVLIFFFIITAYDMQKMKKDIYFIQLEGKDNYKLHVYMAMQLYLDFVNIFLRILTIFGKKRD